MQLVENRFTQVSLDENEEYMGGIFSDVQIAFIRNQMALVANDMLNLTSSGKDTDETYFRMLEHFRGKMLAYEGLIQYSQALKEKMNSEIVETLGKEKQFK